MADICVIVCTYDRPRTLALLLKALVPQLLNEKADLVIIDNGSGAIDNLAMATVPAELLIYNRIPQAGLTAARNAGLRAACTLSPRYIAFIDDDEVPDEDWLQQLRLCLETHRADICCGPYRPYFATSPPRWAVEGGFFAKTGRAIATGNLMMRASLLPPKEEDWFQPVFGFLGGEDEEFFGRLIRRGAHFATANKAWVSEEVPASRMTLDYIWKTGVRDGEIELALQRQKGAGSLSSLAFAFGHSLKKLGYALAHLILTATGAWHGVAAYRDLAEVFGIFRGLFGMAGRYYGQR